MNSQVHNVSKYTVTKRQSQRRCQFSYCDFYKATRMHSSRIRTARSSSHWGRLVLIPLNFPFGCWPGPDPPEFPLGCGPGSDPPQFPPWVWAWKGASLVGGSPWQGGPPWQAGLLSGGVSLAGGGQGVSLAGRGSPWQGGSLVGSPSMHRGRPPCEQNDKQVQKYYLAPNFVCGR